MSKAALLELAERAEKASGPDRELDAEIARQVVPGVANFCDGMKEEYPRYTSSLEAAMTLVPEGRGWNLSGNSNVNYAVVFGNYSRVAATPALALTAACLRARAEMEPSDAR